jgi:AraC-like DNA-binding protein
VSVTEVALGWGFSHLGEFAAHYKARFGDKPSNVLAKRR